MPARNHLAKRHPGGQIVRERVRPTDQHLARRAALGLTERDQCDINEPIMHLKWLTPEQKQASLRYQSLKRAYYASIGLHGVGSIDPEGFRGPSPKYERERDRDLKEEWNEVQDLLTDLGQDARKPLSQLLDRNTMPKKVQYGHVQRGLDALARHWGLTD